SFLTLACHLLALPPSPTRRSSDLRRTLPGRSTGWSRLTPRSRACISTVRPSLGTQGAPPNHKNPRVEPPDHAIGRSRGGLTTKVDRKSTRLNSSHVKISYAVFCLK